MRMKKWYLYTIVAMFVLGLSGCDSETPPSQKTSAPQQQETGTSVQTEPVVAEKQQADSSTSDSTTSSVTKVLWGDTHNHTGNSFDVYLFGTPSSTPDTAYRFAKGLPVTHSKEICPGSRSRL